MKRITTLMAVLLCASISAPLAALADHHEGAEKGKAGADNTSSNAQSSEDATRGQDRAAERHDAHDASAAKKRAAEEADAAKAKKEKDATK